VAIRGALVGFAVAVAVATPASAVPSNLHVLARWDVTEKGSLVHTWSLPSAQPCKPSGDGHVEVHFKSTHAGHIVIADNGHGVGDFGWDGNLNVRGAITAVDNRVRNPPAANDTCPDTGAPVPDKRGCGTAKLTDIMQLEITGHKRSLVGANETNSLHPPDDVDDCETGGLAGFSEIFGGRHGTAHQELPIAYPSSATLAARHGTFSVSAGDTRQFNDYSTTVRHITLTFHRLR
jgi:hypothetical protein